jgi:hypothetical protein
MFVAAHHAGLFGGQALRSGALWGWLPRHASIKRIDNRRRYLLVRVDTDLADGGGPVTDESE